MAKHPTKYSLLTGISKAYKYYFLDPQLFYGAGREIPAPKDLKEIRIGFLGPLEGSQILSLGTQMLQGATSCN